MLFTKYFAANNDDLPSLDNGLLQLVKDEMGNFVLIVTVVLVGFFIAKQSWGRLIGVIGVGAVVYFYVGSPKDTLDTLSGLADLVMGG